MCHVIPTGVGIKIKNSSLCVYCNNVDDLPHYFIRCAKVAYLWSYLFNWWENLSGIDIRDNQVIEECILFGSLFNNEEMQVLNFVFYMQNIIFTFNAYFIIIH